MKRNLLSLLLLIVFVTTRQTMPVAAAGWTTGTDVIQTIQQTSPTSQTNLYRQSSYFNDIEGL